MIVIAIRHLTQLFSGFILFSAGGIFATLSIFSW